MSQPNTPGGTPPATPECRECGCLTGGGDYCYEHVPYTVHPLKNGTFRVVRNGVTRIAFDSPPNAAEELAALRANVEALRQERDYLRDVVLQQTHRITEITARFAALTAALEAWERQYREDAARARHYADEPGTHPQTIRSWLEAAERSLAIMDRLAALRTEAQP